MTADTQSRAATVARIRAATVRERLCQNSTEFAVIAQAKPAGGLEEAHRSSQPLPHGRGSDSRPAFTIVELMVVVVVIALILGIALPGLSAMTSDSRFAAAVQMINGALTRAQIESMADTNMTGLRFVPGKWDAEAGGETAASADRQHVVNLRYRLNTQDPGNPSQVTFSERFERRPESESLVLPPNVWAAPVESLVVSGAIAVPQLEGRIGNFRDDSADSGFLSADDFLIVFDPQNGVRGSGQPIRPNKFTLLAYNADDRNPRFGQEDPDVKRYNFSGIVLYNREAFAALGENASGRDRQELLLRSGRPYYVHRFGGGLVMGTP